MLQIQHQHGSIVFHMHASSSICAAVRTAIYVTVILGTVAPIVTPEAVKFLLYP